MPERANFYLRGKVFLHGNYFILTFSSNTSGRVYVDKPGLGKTENTYLVTPVK